jgi:hypothetical protein
LSGVCRNAVTGVQKAAEIASYGRKKIGPAVYTEGGVFLPDLRGVVDQTIEERNPEA